MSRHGYAQFCPVAKACELVAERWTPLVLRELLCGSHRFSELQRGVPRMSRTLLAQRLRELEDAGIVRSVERENGQGREYHLTLAGEELRPVILQLGEWGQKWTERQIAPADLDAGLLMWDLQRRLDVDELPCEKTVVRFELTGVSREQAQWRTWWLVLERPEIDLCHRNPGFEVDLVVRADLAAFAAIWLGRETLAGALQGGAIEVEGPRLLARSFPRWLRLSEFAPAGRRAAGVRA